MSAQSLAIMLLAVPFSASGQMVFGSAPLLDTSYFAPVTVSIDGDYADDHYADHYPLLFEARLAPNVFFMENLSTLSVQLGKTAYAGAWAFTPRFDLRMVNANSQPVRTPSYRPGFDFVGVIQFGRGVVDVPGPAPTPTHTDLISQKLFFPNEDKQLSSISNLWRLVGVLRVEHYSNGQESGTTYDPVKDDHEPCDLGREFQVGDALGRANLEDGNFSTWIVLRGRVGFQWLGDFEATPLPSDPDHKGELDKHELCCDRSCTEVLRAACKAAIKYREKAFPRPPLFEATSQAEAYVELEYFLGDDGSMEPLGGWKTTQLGFGFAYEWRWLHLPRWGGGRGHVLRLDGSARAYLAAVDNVVDVVGEVNLKWAALGSLALNTIAPGLFIGVTMGRDELNIRYGEDSYRVMFGTFWGGITTDQFYHPGE